MTRYAKVVVAVTAQEVDRVFEYAVPPEVREIGIGSRVMVPFGRSDKRVEAYVVGLSDVPDYTGRGMKSVDAIIDGGPVFDAELLELAVWMSGKYSATLYECLRTIIPAGVKLAAETLLTLHGEAQAAKLSPAQAAVAEYIRRHGGNCLLSELENEVDRARPVVAALVRLGVVTESHNVQDMHNLELYVQYAYMNYDTDEADEPADTGVMSGAAKAVVEFLTERGGTPVSDIRKFLKISASPIKTLAAKGIIVTERVRVKRSTTASAEEQGAAVRHKLTEDQERAVREILPGGKLVNLVHGVTGSGKTEIYMRLIEYVLEQGRQAIMLVPEISLTPQTVSTLFGRFGRKLSVTHSRLSLGERYDQWKKARDGEISIMIGPRSAVFAPFANLGLIVIDEEHEKTYKSETTPKYSTLEVAEERVRISGGKGLAAPKPMVVLGSATPMVETYHDALAGRVKLVSINTRVNDSPPEIHVVDMRQELAEGNTTMFSRPLERALRANYAAGHQSILFLNRRGFSTFVSCRRCGFVMQCDSCSINYTYHTFDKRLMCHYCGRKVRNPATCPQCDSRYIKYFGLGTQRVEEEVAKLLPGVGIARMDMDTTSGKHKHEEILARFRTGEAGVLIGTQMIAKGLDFPGVTTVGVVAADLSLNSGDFRAAETTFQLLTQVAGRAGRGAHKGDVYIQTYQPEHYAIICAKHADYNEFYDREIILRRQMEYPPFSHILTILASGESEKLVISLLHKLLDIMRALDGAADCEMLGPSPAVVSKIKHRYRWRLILKHRDEAALRDFANSAAKRLRTQEDTSGITLNITLNPLTIY
ncbi:MAG: primosomal protein N' [Defluviitaleaceae bacterium]|nr:primosomal protein N' [Defluviitaleaceae bacterium]